jgi:hypothetical protein
MSFHPDPWARAVLLGVGAVAGILVASVPAFLLMRTNESMAANIVIFAGMVLGFLRTNRVGVWADDAGLTVRNIWSTQVLRWKRVDRIMLDRRAWLPGVIVPTLRLRGGEAELLPMLGAAGSKAGLEIDALRRLHTGTSVPDWRSEQITSGPGVA